MNAKYVGQNLGDGYTPVNLHVPFRKCGKITLHKLAGDPRLGNRERMNIEIQSQEVPASELGEGKFAVNERSGGGPGGVPPGSIYLYVFEATE